MQAMVARLPITYETTFRKWCANAEAIEVRSMDEAYPDVFIRRIRHLPDQGFQAAKNLSRGSGLNHPT